MTDRTTTRVRFAEATTTLRRTQGRPEQCRSATRRDDDMTFHRAFSSKETRGRFETAFVASGFSRKWPRGAKRPPELGSLATGFEISSVVVSSWRRVVVPPRGRLVSSATCLFE